MGSLFLHPLPQPAPWTPWHPRLPQDDFAALGVDLKGLIDSGALELHYSEFGVGGAGRETGVPATSVIEVATFPFAGVDGVYTPRRDPWLVPMLKNYALEFYAKVAAWLANPYNKTHRCGAWRGSGAAGWRRARGGDQRGKPRRPAPLGAGSGSGRLPAGCGPHMQRAAPNKACGDRTCTACAP